VSTETRDLLLLVVAVVTAAGCAYYYIAAVLDEDRPLSRVAALAFFVFGVVSAVFIRRLF
jgi:Na+/melibiose symporter-like transporter